MRLVPGVLQHHSLITEVKQITISTIWLVLGNRNGNPMLHRIIDQRRPGGEVPFTPGSDNLYFWIKNVVSQLKADLIVPLACRTMRYSIRPFHVRNSNLLLSNQGAGNGGSQKIVVLIKRIGPKHGKDKIPNKFLAQVFDINLAGPGCQGFLSNRIQLLALPHIGRKSDDFTIIFFLHPFDNDGGIQST